MYLMLHLQYLKNPGPFYLLLSTYIRSWGLILSTSLPHLGLSWLNWIGGNMMGGVINECVYVMVGM